MNYNTYDSYQPSQVTKLQIILGVILAIVVIFVLFKIPISNDREIDLAHKFTMGFGAALYLLHFYFTNPFYENLYQRGIVVSFDVLSLAINGLNLVLVVAMILAADCLKSWWILAAFSSTHVIICLAIILGWVRGGILDFLNFELGITSRYTRSSQEKVPMHENAAKVALVAFLIIILIISVMGLGLIHEQNVLLREFKLESGQQMAALMMKQGETLEKVAEAMKAEGLIAEDIANILKAQQASAMDIANILKTQGSVASDIATILKNQEVDSKTIADILKNQGSSSTDIAAILKSQGESILTIAEILKGQGEINAVIEEILKQMELNSTEIANIHAKITAVAPTPTLIPTATPVP